MVAYHYYILFFLINSLSTLKINANFKYCTYNDNSPELETHDCDFNNKNIEKTKQIYNVLDRTEFSLYGYGYRCSITEITFLTKTSFFNSIRQEDYPPRSIDIVLF